MILLQLGACAEVGGQPTPFESCTPWPPAPPEPSSGDACDVQEATCRAWERCIVIDGRPGECRRDCTLEPCPSGERCEHVDWYDDPGGTGHGTYSSVDSCVAAEDVPERGATGFGPWLYQGDTPAYARSLAVGGGWVAVATDQGPHRGFVAPIRTDGTLGDRVTFDREIRNPVLHRVGGQLHLWSRDVESGGLWSTVLEEDGTLLPGVVVDGPPFGSAMRVVGARGPRLAAASGGSSTVAVVGHFTGDLGGARLRRGRRAHLGAERSRPVDPPALALTFGPEGSSSPEAHCRSVSGRGFRTTLPHSRRPVDAASSPLCHRAAGSRALPRVDGRSGRHPR